MVSRVTFRRLLTLLALVVPAALGPGRPATRQEPASAPPQASSETVFRHYL